MTKDEVMKLALEALEGLFGTAEQFEGGGVAVWRLGGSAQPKQAIAALRLAIDVQNMASESTYKQQKQEPVAWHYPGGKPDQCTTDKAYAEKEPAWTPMYYKHEWVDLTDEERKEIWWSCEQQTPTTFVKAIEQALKEKNT